MSAGTRAWIDDSLAQLERMEEEHIGLVDALEDIERRMSELSSTVDETDSLLDALEDEASTVNVTKLELDGRRAMLARRHAVLWDRLLELWKEWESVKGSERALAIEEKRLHERSRSLPAKLSSAEFKRKTLEHQLASLHRLRREVAEEAANLELEKTRMFRALERVADQAEARTREARAREDAGSGLRTVPLRLVPPSTSSPHTLPLPRRLEHAQKLPAAPLHIVTSDPDPTPMGLERPIGREPGARPLSDGVPLLLAEPPAMPAMGPLPTPPITDEASFASPPRHVDAGVPVPDEVFLDPGRDASRSSEILLKVDPSQRKGLARHLAAARGALTGAFVRLPVAPTRSGVRALRLAVAFGVPIAVGVGWGVSRPLAGDALAGSGAAVASVLIAAAEVEPEQDEPVPEHRVLRTPPTFANDEDSEGASKGDGKKPHRSPVRSGRARRSGGARKAASSSEDVPQRGRLSVAVGNDPLAGI